MDINVDASVFSKMAELLARPLSPTALEKEEQLAAGTPQSSKSGKTHSTGGGSSSSRSAKAAAKTSARPKATAKSPATARAAASSSKRGSPTASAAEVDLPAVAGDVAELPASPERSLAAEEIADCEGRRAGGGSILSAVAGLSDLQQEWKDKMKSPSHRKSGPPKMKRPPQPKVLTEEERRDKMTEIDSLEAQLAQARNVAAAAKAVAAATVEASHAAVQGSAVAAPTASQDQDEEDESGDGVELEKSKPDSPEEGASDFHRQAEERVKAQKRQEAIERKKKQREESAMKEARHAEAEAKAKELERQASQRVQDRLRAERAREQRMREEEEQHAKLKEQKAQEAGEELRQQAARRVSEREEALKQRAQEMSKRESEEQRLRKEENEMRAQELRQKTRLRMQQRTCENREQQLAEEEMRRRELQEAAEAAENKQRQTALNQQRAMERAAEFRQRTRNEEEARARIAEEQQANEQRRAEAALRDRQQKRQWRAGHNSASPAEMTNSEDCNVEQPGLNSEASQAAVPARARQVPPRPSLDRVKPADHAPATSVGQPGTCVAGHQANIPDRGQSKSTRNNSRGRGVTTTRRGVQMRKNSQVSRKDAQRASEIVSPTCNAAESDATTWCPVVEDGDTVQCTVGFFGIGGDMDDEDEEDDNQLKCDDDAKSDISVAKQVGGYVGSKNQEGSYASKAKAARLPSRGSSRGSTRASSAVAPPLPPGNHRAGARAVSQPPLTRADIPLAEDSRPSSRCSSPALPAHIPLHHPNIRSPRSPDAGSSFSEPTTGGHSPRGSPAVRKAEPWKQKVVQVKSADYYLDALKAARSKPLSKGKNASAVGGRAVPQSGGYAEQLRQRASDVEVLQRAEEGARMERGYAALQRVQSRALQATPTRSMSAG